jgi:hypothetical protein
MELPEINLRYAAIAVAILVVAVLFLVFNPFQAKAINAYFDPVGIVKPGQQATLVVELTNTAGQDIAREELSVAAIDAASITVGEMPPAQQNVAKGDVRKFRIPITVGGSATEGTYSLEITAGFDAKQEKTRITLEVRK